MFQKNIWLGLIVVLAFTTIVVAQSSNFNQEQQPTNDLVFIAQNALKTESELYTAEGSLVESKNDFRFANGMRGKFDLAEKNRTESLQNGYFYKDVSNNISNERAVVRKRSASLFLTDHRSRILVSPDGNETQTEEIIEHQFDFSLKYGNWVLERDTYLNTPKLEPLKKGEEPITDPSTDVSVFLKYDEEPNDPLVSVNRNSVAVYALTYWSSYNTNYRSFPNDCTNFTSQALKYGGWTMISGLYTLDSVWWYNSLNQSRTWAGAHNFYYFARNYSGRASRAPYISSLRVGDMLQADLDANGNIEHSMIVTKVSNGVPYLTYHTTNTKNKSFTEIQRSYPNARWYGWNLYSSY